MNNTDAQTCTRPKPHVCRVNGPCNGWPRDADAQAERVLRAIEDMAATDPETVVRELWEACIKRSRVCTDCGFMNYPGYPAMHFSTCSTRRTP